ncbi:MAG: carboxypeptidase regulatory-like domain-containing protein [Candidatus Sericytochromatia bacterium]
MRTFFALCSVVALSSFALTGCLPAAKPLVRVEFPTASPSSNPTASHSSAPPAGLRQFDLVGRVSTPTGPAAGARISIDNTPFQTQADSNGAFRFEQLPANQARSLSASSTGPNGTRYSQRLPLSPSGPQVDLAPLLLSETGSVYGQVSLEGEVTGQSDLTGVLVFLAGTPMGAFTTSAGEYFLSGLAPGSYTLTAYKEGYAPVTGSIVVESGKPTSLNLKLAAKSNQAPQTASLSGQVQSSAGPLPGVTVHLAGESFLALSDSQGRFKLSGLPAGSFTLLAQREGYLPLSQSITFKAGEKVQKDLLLQAQTESVQGRLRGQLQDSGGQPLSEIEIETIPPTQRVKTNAQGRFELPGLEPGSYYLRARKANKTQASRFVALDPGQTAEVILRGHALSSALGSTLCDQQNQNQVNVSAPGVEVHVTINNHNECLLSLP